MAIKDLQAVYKKTAEASGIIHTANVKRPKVAGSTYSVELQPLGLQRADCLPKDETEAKYAAHGLLHGLLALHSVSCKCHAMHRVLFTWSALLVLTSARMQFLFYRTINITMCFVQAGFVHRDLRWDNVAADVTKTRYFLLDLELCGRKGATPKFHLGTWGADTLVEGTYTAASDLTQLGKLLQSVPITSTDGQHFLQKLQVPASALQASAADLLRHSWIGCSGASCGAAGAMPGEL